MFYGCCNYKYITIKMPDNSLFADSLEIKRNLLIEEGLKIWAFGKWYYNKPKIKGDGEKSYEGFTVPIHLTETTTWLYIITIIRNEMLIECIGKFVGYDNQNNAKVDILTSPYFIKETYITN